MPPRYTAIALLALALLACREPATLREPEPAPGAPVPAATGTGAFVTEGRPVATLGPDDAVPRSSEAIAPVAAPAGPPLTAAGAFPGPGAFDPDDVAASRATLPPFPLLQPPAGLRSMSTPADQAREFDREHMIAGDAVVALEGRVFRARYRLAGGGRDYSEFEFHRHYRDAIAALGGTEVSRIQYTHAGNAAFGGRAAVDRHYHGTCASPGCENHTYLIRQGDREYWLQVSSGGVPLHGQVTVLERGAIASPLEPVGVREMKQALDATGKVALQLEFDPGHATLRDDAMPVVEQIATLLRDDPALKLSIEGHTDNVGEPGRNRELSDQRAEAVVAALVAAGIDPPRLDGAGFGGDQPIADNATEAGRAKNRRIELRRVTDAE